MMRKKPQSTPKKKNQINVVNKRCLVLAVFCPVFHGATFVDSIGRISSSFLCWSWWLEEFNKFDQTSMFVCYCSFFVVACCFFPFVTSMQLVQESQCTHVLRVSWIVFLFLFSFVFDSLAAFEGIFLPKRITFQAPSTFDIICRHTNKPIKVL